VPDVPHVECWTTEELTDALLEQVRQLCLVAFHGRFDDDDWQHGLGGHHFILQREGRVISHAAVVPRVLVVAGMELAGGYVESVATVPSQQREGLGSQVVSAARDLIRARFAVGALSTGSQSFYERLGWQRWRGPTFVIESGQRVRTPDEDDAVMVLRCAASADIELTSEIACFARAGDDW
jgi:aminoglycoside 2'-N-acetyltransferase I